MTTGSGRKLHRKSPRTGTPAFWSCRTRAESHNYQTSYRGFAACNSADHAQLMVEGRWYQCLHTTRLSYVEAPLASCFIRHWAPLKHRPLMKWGQQFSAVRLMSDLLSVNLLFLCLYPSFVTLSLSLSASVPLLSRIYVQIIGG